MSVTDYFNKMKFYGDEMVAVREVLDDEELVSYILAGLGPEYDSVVSSVLGRSDPISVTELYALLLNYEQRHAPGAYSRWWLLKFVGQRCLPWAQWRTARPYPWRWWP